MEVSLVLYCFRPVDKNRKDNEPGASRLCIEGQIICDCFVDFDKCVMICGLRAANWG